MSNGHQLKLEGIDKVSDGNEKVLLYVQWLISCAITVKGQATSDDVYFALKEHRLPPHVNKNIMGAAFSKHPSIRKSGEYVKSKRPEAHSRMIAVWQRK